MKTTNKRMAALLGSGQQGPAKIAKKPATQLSPSVQEFVAGKKLLEQTGGNLLDASIETPQKTEIKPINLQPLL